MHGDAQPSSHDVIFDYSVRYVVAGTRNYDDYEFFSKVIWDTIALHEGIDILFISGKARTGADAMIIQFCKEHGFPWVEFEAKWDELGKRAGFVRNIEMAQVCTHLLSFWDGVSRGTKHMVETCEKLERDVMTILIDVIRKPNHAWKSQSRGENHSRLYREVDPW